MTTRFDPPDPHDPLAARLRDALHTEADMAHPSDDGLEQIRSGIDAGRRQWWRHPAVVAVAAAAVLGLAAGGAVVALTGDDGGTTVIARGTEEPSSTDISDPAVSETATPSASPSPMPIEGDVYVYYVMDDDAGPRLYRELRPNIGMDPVTMGLSTMLAEPALDPDYSSPWSGAELISYTVVGDTATVELAGSPISAGQVTPIGLQQIVYTVTANDKSVKIVRVFLGNRLVSPDDQITRAPMVDVQGLIWLLTPTQGSTVPSPVGITGVGTAFEGTISWVVHREGSDTVVAEGFTQGGANGEFGEFNDTVELEAGTYEIRAYESSAEDGRWIHMDTKTFTVE